MTQGRGSLTSIDRRGFLAGGVTAAVAASAAAQAWAQQAGHEHHGGLYESLQKSGRIGLPENAATQHAFDSPAPKSANKGRWVAKGAAAAAKERDGVGDGTAVEVPTSLTRAPAKPDNRSGEALPPGRNACTTPHRLR